MHDSQEKKKSLSRSPYRARNRRGLFVDVDCCCSELSEIYLRGVHRAPRVLNPFVLQALLLHPLSADHEQTINSSRATALVRRLVIMVFLARKLGLSQMDTRIFQLDAVEHPISLPKGEFSKHSDWCGAGVKRKAHALRL